MCVGCVNGVIDRDVPHSHYTVDNLVEFVKEKGNSGISFIS